VEDDEEVLDLVRAWQRWKTFGAFPMGGSMDDQPQYILEAFEAAELGVARHQEYLNRKRRAENNGP